MLCRLQRRVKRGINRRQITNQVHLLTVYELPYETVDKPESLSCCSPSFFLHELFQPLPGRLDVLYPEVILDHFDCTTLSKVTRQGERTYAIVAASAFESPEQAWRLAPRLS
jgi:hypothetical protein